jgi:hypothetical protein
MVKQRRNRKTKSVDLCNQWDLIVGTFEIPIPKRQRIRSFSDTVFEGFFQTLTDFSQTWLG